MDLVVYDLGRPNLLYDVVVTNPLRSNANRLTAKIPTPPGRRGTTRSSGAEKSTDRSVCEKIVASEDFASSPRVL
jgi:hypothetical protein